MGMRRDGQKPFADSAQIGDHRDRQREPAPAPTPRPTTAETSATQKRRLEEESRGTDQKNKKVERAEESSYTSSGSSYERTDGRNTARSGDRRKKDGRLRK